MKLTNCMEHAVRGHLNHLRAQSPAGDETCWCPLCRADMMALALSSIPPRYATRRPQDIGIDDHAKSVVNERVDLARKQVQRLPKHQRGSATTAGESVWVVNFPLEEGFRAVDVILRQHDGACDCWNCRCDIVAFALNRYPARYGVEHEGRTRLFPEDRMRMREELASFLDLAARVVTTVPRHDFKPAA